MPGIKFGVEPNMREVPPGEAATVKLASFTKWEIKETDYGMKYCIPVTLFSHPSYDSIPSKGMKLDWMSKANASRLIFFWVYDEDHWNEEEELKVRPFDFDLARELSQKWKLTRFETGAYKVEQM